MADFSSGHISSEEGKELFASLQPEIPGVMVRAGVSYRNLLVVHGGKGACINAAPRYCRAGDCPVPAERRRCGVCSCTAWRRAAPCSRTTR